MDKTQADIVLGPVTAHYPSGAPAWMMRGDFHSTRPVWVKGTITTGYCGNVLLKRHSPMLKELYFHEGLGKTGGEDTAFFHTAHQNGATIAYAKDAILHENVPAQRATFSWLCTRRFRTGQSHAAIILNADSMAWTQRAKTITHAMAKIAFCVLRMLISLTKPIRWRFWLLRAMFHVGVLSRLLGKREIRQYGSTPNAAI